MMAMAMIRKEQHTRLDMHAVGATMTLDSTTSLCVSIITCPTTRYHCSMQPRIIVFDAEENTPHHLTNPPTSIDSKGFPHEEDDAV
jgi:hypothetical protein